jgi:DNA ligase-1
MTLFADVVLASSQVAETTSRSRKVAILAELLRRLDAAEIAIVTGFLSGAPRQGRVGVGYSMIYAVDSTPSPAASLTIDDVDGGITELQETTGSGSGARRRQLLESLLGRSTADEAAFIRRPRCRPRSHGVR